MNRRPFFRVLVSAGGVSLISQAVGLLRQILLISAFGFTRDLDIYSTIYAVLSISVFSFAAIVDSIFISLLSGVKEDRGNDAFRGVLGAYVRASLAFSVMLVSAVSAFFPLISMPFTAGFDGIAKAGFQLLALYCLPWALLVVPYTAMGACLKCGWKYRQFFLAELLVTLVSTASIYLRHEHISDAALAFAYGYGAGALFLAFGVWRLSIPGGGECFPWRVFFSRISRHFASNQAGTLCSLLERFWFSYLPSGGIAALALVQQLTMNLGSLLSFRDAYLIPLAEASARPQKISRLLIGLFLVALAAAIVVIALAEPLCAVLFQYGKVAARDIVMVANLMIVSMVGMVVSVVATPIWRLQQMMGDYRPLARVYVVTAASTLVLGQLLIGSLQLGPIGMALIVAFNAAWACVVAVRYARTYGATASSQELQLLLISFIVFCLAGAASWKVSSSFSGNGIVQLLAGGSCYAVVLVIYALVSRRQLLAIANGGRLA